VRTLDDRLAIIAVVLVRQVDADVDQIHGRGSLHADARLSPDIMGL
jgi:hypothetical protein